MALKSAIEWTESTWNPVTGCTKISQGCKFCYAQRMAALEQSDFAALPTGTFLRGFVRNYAKALGLNPDETLALLEKTQPAAIAVKATRTVAPDLQNIRVSVPEGFSSGRMRALAVGAVAVALLAACWYWWVNVRPYLGDGGRAPVLPGEQVVPLPAEPPSATTAKGALSVEAS